MVGMYSFKQTADLLNEHYAFNFMAVMADNEEN